MGGRLRDEEPTSPFFRPRDIYNDRQKLRFSSLGGNSATQTFIGHLQDSGLPYCIKYDEDDENKIQGVFWTYPWCQMM